MYQLCRRVVQLTRCSLLVGLLGASFVSALFSSSVLAAAAVETDADKLNDRGLALRSAGQTDEAIGVFLSAADAADAADTALIDSARGLRYRLNAVRAMVTAGDRPRALDQLSRITRALKGVADASPDSRLAVADLYRTLVNDLDASPAYRLQAFEQLQLAQAALAKDDHARQSWVWGYQGAFYEDEQRFEESLKLTRLAIGAAQQTSGEVPLYRWEWQLGRAFAGLGRNTDAVEAYTRAAASLAQQRGALLGIEGSYNAVVRPLYYQFADLLLAQALNASDPTDRQAFLQEVQGALEAVKAAEVEDYFQERCAVENSSSLNAVVDGTAVLYPIILQDRLELVMSANGAFTHVSVPVGQAELVSAIRDFRLNIQVDSATQDYLRLAQRLYGWLLKPLEAEFTRQSIDTLVVIPDGALRTIPLAALHDGTQYVVERFALATAPGLNLVAGVSKDAVKKTALVTGLSESVQGFSALPSVADELSAIQGTLPSRVLKDQAFTKRALTRELTLGGYSVVHLATHGQFRGNYSDSFLLTHDDRLQINELGDALLKRQATYGPLDLLVLSACETAAGDDRAALGVAGVAIKSGARTAVASLWEVDDAATKELIAAFYNNLAQAPEVSKANHLRAAQQQLLNQSALNHPSNWAPFLVIGDWL